MLANVQQVQPRVYGSKTIKLAHDASYDVVEMASSAGTVLLGFSKTTGELRDIMGPILLQPRREKLHHFCDDLAELEACAFQATSGPGLKNARKIRRPPGPCSAGRRTSGSSTLWADEIGSGRPIFPRSSKFVVKAQQAHERINRFGGEKMAEDYKKEHPAGPSLTLSTRPTKRRRWILLMRRSAIRLQRPNSRLKAKPWGNPAVSYPLTT